MKKRLFFSTVIVLLFTVLISLFAMNQQNYPSNDGVTNQSANLSDLPVLQEAKMPALSIKGSKDSSEVYLQSLDIQVEVTGNIATTKYTMVFKNRTGKILEGELLFPLPDGITVSHYALDINGKMREAVPVEKAKATQVFEEIVQRRVDPGLLERVEGNNFRTRVYPIPANGTRTVSIGYEEELPVMKQAFYYRLPMDYKDVIENFSLKATVWKSSQKPQMDKNSDNEIVFDRVGENYVAEFSRKNYQSNHSLIFSLPAPVDVPQVLMQSASGSYYFVASCMPDVKSIKKQWSDKIAVIWDVSLSGAKRNFEKEYEVLDIIFQDKKNLSVSLYLLNNELKKDKSFEIRNGNWSDFKKYLENLIYDGGTNFQAINLQNISDNEILFFSDGLSSLSDADFTTLSSVKKPVHTIVSSPKADYSSLKWISAQTSGKYINLNAISDNTLKYELQNETLHFIGIENNNKVREVYPSVATPVQGNFSIAGILDAKETNVTLLFGYGNKVEKKVTLKLNANEATQQGNIYRVWAQKKINELDMRYEKNKQELTELGQTFGIVTRNTSLIVLETLQDYITYNIVPPAELRDEYFRWKKGVDEQRARTQQDLLNTATASAKELKEWWNTDFKPQKSRYPSLDELDGLDLSALTGRAAGVNLSLAEVETSAGIGSMGDVNIVEEEIEIIQTAYELPPPPALDIVEEINIVEDDVAFMIVEEAPMPAFRGNTERDAEKQTAVQRTSQPVIRIEPLKQDKDYLKNLTGKSESDYALYLKIRAEYMNTPDFYFDMADWFYRLGDKGKAVRILTSIAEIDLENASLYRLLGYRLKEYQEYKLEEYICQKVIQWRPMEPQSYRDYALALADNGMYQLALDTLYSVITQTYTQNTNSRSRGIEEVVVTEINQLIDKYKLKTNAINKDLIQSMPVDIRVVINWNMNNTDIDLHLTDPNGETCYYGHRSTQIGGRISYDITQGYGPEQFMLKKAIKGKYKVFVNYYGDSQVKAEGPSTIMAEIFTNYAGKEEQRKVVCLQLSKENKKEKNGMLKVAEFEF
jgi:Uncharacterized protein conserved in bacteria